MAFNFNKAVQEDSKNGAGFKSSDFQKILTDDAPSLGFISSKAPCEFILVPPHPMHGASTMLTSGGFRNDAVRGVVPTLGQYGIDWVMVYRKIGNDPDPRKRKDLLAINMVEGEEGMGIQTERDWGNGYKSPMYILREYLWKAGGGHKYDKTQRRSIPTINVDTTSARYKRALELVPIDGNDLNTPLGRATRTMFLQGFMVNNAGISYTTDEEGQACWPKHKILMINQISAIKSREDARTKEGFYDAWFERMDGKSIDPESIMREYGDISNSEQSQAAWEQGFKHGDFATSQKLVTFNSYPSGPAGIATYCCSVNNLADRFGPNYIMPDDVLKKVRPFSDYIAQNNRELQVQWLLELFPGDEWAFIEAGIIQDGSNKVSMSVPAYEPPAPAPVQSRPAPIAPIALPTMPRAPAGIQTPARSGPTIPTAGIRIVPASPTPLVPAPGIPMPNQQSSSGGADLSAQMKALMSKLQNNANKAN